MIINLSNKDANGVTLGAGGEAANNHIEDSAGDDTILGQEGDDFLQGNEGNDRLEGWTGDDENRGRKGDDVLFGATGADILYGDLGNDIMYGEEDNDIFVIAVESNARDTIKDFDINNEKIDLSAYNESILSFGSIKSKLTNNGDGHAEKLRHHLIEGA